MGGYFFSELCAQWRQLSAADACRLAPLSPNSHIVNCALARREKAVVEDATLCCTSGSARAGVGSDNGFVNDCREYASS
jgi:hypothetical protein